MTSIQRVQHLLLSEYKKPTLPQNEIEYPQSTAEPQRLDYFANIHAEFNWRTWRTKKQKQRNAFTLVTRVLSCVLVVGQKNTERPWAHVIFCQVVNRPANTSFTPSIVPVHTSTLEECCIAFKPSPIKQIREATTHRFIYKGAQLSTLFTFSWRSVGETK